MDDLYQIKDIQVKCFHQEPGEKISYLQIIIIKKKEINQTQ